jgi:lipopolysaccharide/colanic/teichoic acid biosynthesis glycosyltransferase
MLKRLFDIFFSITGLIILSPLLVIISLLVGLTSKGGILYLQSRVGRGNKDFKVLKFRTMKAGSDKKGLLTVGGRDPRITQTGYFLRRYKLDELPQLFNVLAGTMSMVGPRPEVRKYVELYTDEQKKVLEIKPGITDYASLEYYDENEILAASSDPEAVYIKKVMPAKLELNKKYIREAGLLTDLKIILRTIKRMFN